jgi:hypothetical protein
LNPIRIPGRRFLHKPENGDPDDVFHSGQARRNVHRDDFKVIFNEITLRSLDVLIHFRLSLCGKYLAHIKRFNVGDFKGIDGLLKNNLKFDYFGFQNGTSSLSAG